MSPMWSTSRWWARSLTARRPRSANTPQASEIFKLGRGRNPGGGLGDPGDDLAGSVTFGNYQSSTSSAHRCRRSSMRPQRIGYSHVMNRSNPTKAYVVLRDEAYVPQGVTGESIRAGRG
jgi:hypothetical protein